MRNDKENTRRDSVSNPTAGIIPSSPYAVAIRPAASVLGGVPFPVVNSCIDGYDCGLILAYLLKGGARGER